MSVPTQKTMGTAWMEMASMSVHTPELLSSSPMAIPSNRLCTDRATTTITLQVTFLKINNRGINKISHFSFNKENIENFAKIDSSNKQIIF